MSKAELRFRLDDGRRTLTLEMIVDDDPRAHMFLDASELDGLIANLGDVRASMLDEVPKELDRGSRAPAVEDPVWRYASIPGRSEKTLALRHPGLGWIAFLFPDPEARSIAKYLAA
jgi:hypothetical protein